MTRRFHGPPVEGKWPARLRPVSTKDARQSLPSLSVPSMRPMSPNKLHDDLSNPPSRGAIRHATG